MPFEEPRGTPTHHVFPLLLARADRRTAFMERLKSHGVQSSVHYPPIHLFRVYRDRCGTKAGDLPRTEDFAAREVTVPLFPTMTDDQVETVILAVRDAAKGL
jgi:dTDP-4-amino-4,6-dideoxygalactose transaminase